MRFTGEKLGGEICDAIGVDKHMVRALTFRCAVGEPAVVDLECYVETDNPDDIPYILKSYRLVERES